MIREVFLVASFTEADPSDPCLWKCPDGTTWLDYQVRQIQNLGRTPWLVVGDNGDEILFKTKAARELNLVYDTLRVHSLWTGLWSAAHGASNAAFVLPINTPVPPAPVWNQLLTESSMGALEWYKEKVALQPHSGKTPGFPLLLNAAAFKAIATTPLVALNTVSSLFRPVKFEDEENISAFSSLRSPSEIQRWTRASS